MTRKRKSEATPRLDEADRTIYSTFCGAANSLSQLYTQAMNHQKTTFQAGERHAYEKLYHWILRQHEEGSRVTVSDVLSHIQNEIDNGGEDATMSPRILFQPQHPQPTTHSPNLVNQSPFSVFGPATLPHGHRGGNPDQAKNSVFSNALSSPVRRSLQRYHLAQGGGGYYANVPPSGNAGGRNQDPNQSSDSNSSGSTNAPMDMHSDSPPHDSY